MYTNSHPAEGSVEGMEEVVGLILGVAEGVNEGEELGCSEGEALGDFEGLFSEGQGRKNSLDEYLRSYVFSWQRNKEVGCRTNRNWIIAPFRRSR